MKMRNFIGFALVMFLSVFGDTFSEFGPVERSDGGTPYIFSRLAVDEVSDKVWGPFFSINRSTGEVKDYSDSAQSFFWWEPDQIFPTGNGGVWISGFLVKTQEYDGTKWIVHKWPISDSLNSLVGPLVIEPSGRIWYALAWGGELFRLEGDTHTPMIVSEPTLMLRLDSKGRVWRIGDSGVARWNGAAWENWSYEPQVPNAVLTDAQMESDANGSLCVSYKQQDSKVTGVWCLNPVSSVWQHFQQDQFVNGNINGIGMDRGGRLWLGTDSGLVRIGKDGADRREWNSTDWGVGIKNVTDKVLDVEVDENDDVWFSTIGIYRFVPTEKPVSTLLPIADERQSQVKLLHQSSAQMFDVAGRAMPSQRIFYPVVRKFSKKTR